MRDQSSISGPTWTSHYVVVTSRAAVPFRWLDLEFHSIRMADEPDLQSTPQPKIECSPKDLVSDLGTEPEFRCKGINQYATIRG